MTASGRSFAPFVHEHRAAVMAVALAATGDRAIAEELVQETFLVAWCKRERVREPELMRAWLCGIARRLAANARRRRRCTSLGVEVPDGALTPLEALVHHERRHLVRAALAALPARHGEPLVRFYLAGDSVEEVARALGISPLAARKRLSRARRALRGRLTVLAPGGWRRRVGTVLSVLVVSWWQRARAAGRAALQPSMRVLPASAPLVITGVLALHVMGAGTAAIAGGAPAVVPAPARAVPARAIADVPATGPRPIVRATPEPGARPAAAPRPVPVVAAAVVRPTVAAPPAPSGKAPRQAASPPPAPAAARDTAVAASLRRGLDFYRKKQLHAASIELHKALAASGSDAERARYFLAVTLVGLGLPSAAIPHLETIAGAGATHAHWRDVPRWLARIARTQPDAAARLLAGYPVAILDGARDPERSTLAYLLGRQRYHAGALADATSALARVTSGPHVLHARYLAGVVAVRRGQPARAARAWTAVIAEAAAAQATPPDERARLVSLATLGLARLRYAAGQYREAIVYFRRVPRKSPLWPTAILESAWAYLRAGQPDRALGQLHTLRAPYFDDELFPEALEIESIIYFAHCHHRLARQRARAFHGRYGPISRGLQRLVEGRADDSTRFFALGRDLRRWHTPRGEDRYRPAILVAAARRARIDRDVLRVAGAAVIDHDVDRAFAAARALAAEQAHHEAQDAAWRSTDAGIEALQSIALQRALAEGDAGELVRRRLARRGRELARHRANVRRVQLELLQREAERGGQPWPADPPLQVHAIDGHGRYWPWQGEYWRDELGRYFVDIESACER